MCTLPACCCLCKALPDLMRLTPHVISGLLPGSVDKEFHSPNSFKRKFFKKWLAFTVSLANVLSELRHESALPKMLVSPGYKMPQILHLYFLLPGCAALDVPS